MVSVISDKLGPSNPSTQKSFLSPCLPEGFPVHICWLNVISIWPWGIPKDSLPLLLAWWNCRPMPQFPHSQLGLYKWASRGHTLAPKWHLSLLNVWLVFKNVDGPPVSPSDFQNDAQKTWWWIPRGIFPDALRSLTSSKQNGTLGDRPLLTNSLRSPLLSCKGLVHTLSWNYLELFLTHLCSPFLSRRYLFLSNYSSCCQRLPCHKYMFITTADVS